jgi:hypothetical protein
VCGRLENNEFLFEILVKPQNRRNVVATITVIGGRPDCHQCLIEHLSVALHNKLMGSADKGQTINTIKLLDHIAAEKITSAAGAEAPSTDFVWV